MINKIGVLCQDRNSFGFLLGIQRRLECEPELVEPTTGVLAKSMFMSRKQAKLATEDLRKKQVDLILRFTDADGNPWQKVTRHEKDVFPDNVDSILLCAVAVENVKQWLALDRGYLASALDIANVHETANDDLTGVIKRAIAKKRDSDKPVSEVTARIVADAPPEVFRRWLKADPSLRRFYQDCRAAAIQADCDVLNELDE